MFASPITTSRALIRSLPFAGLALAQYGSNAGSYNGYSNTNSNNDAYSNGAQGGPYDSQGANSGNSNSPYAFGDGRGRSRGPFGDADPMTIIAAHAILATVAFGAIFPIGGIMIRLCSFPKAWLLHSLFQVIGLCMYGVAFGLGVYMASHLELFNEAHITIGIVLFALILIQPFSGLLHHSTYKQVKARGFWSYAHIWFGRSVVVLGIVNGGLGLELGQRLPFARPNQTWIIIYSAVAGSLGVLYIFAAIRGESRRKTTIALQRKRGSRASSRSHTSSRSSRSRKSAGKPASSNGKKPKRANKIIEKTTMTTIEEA